MPLFGRKRRRSYKNAGLEPTSLLAEWLPRILRERSILLPLCLGLLAVVALVCAVEGWRSVFPYRIGSRVDRDLVARVGFQRIDLSATEQKRAEKKEDVKPIFLQNPSKLDELPGKLHNHLTEISKAETLEAVPAPVRAAFGLEAETAAPPAGTAGSATNRFQTLKAVISGEGTGAGTRIDYVVREFRRFIGPLKKYGRASPAEIVRLKLRPNDEVTIAQAGPSGELQKTVTAYPADIVLEESLKEQGPLGKHWKDQSEFFNIRPELEHWLLSETPFTLEYDEQATAEARRRAVAGVEPVYTTFLKGQPLVAAGQVIDEETLAILQAEYRAYEAKTDWSKRLGRLAMVTLLAILLSVLVGYYLVRNEQKLVRSPVRLGIYLGTVVVAVFVGRLLSTGAWRAEIIPLTVTVMIFAVAYNQRLALMTALTLSLVVALSTTADLTHFVVLLAVTSATVVPLSQVPSRSALIKVGFWSAAVYFVMSWSTEVVWNQAVGTEFADVNVLLASLRGAGCCLLAGYLVAGSLPFVESAFGVVTDISLLEMSDVSHPLLQELARRAPGTYNHSVTVATIGEAAADAIGANGLLVRIGAYFHDIGKMLKPEYFIENVAAGTESRHKNLAPAMSTLIIIGHVKDGVDLARQHNLPQGVIDFIEQHHGTTLVEYFYHAAAKQAEAQPDHRTDAEESSFRYPGPKPQTKEAGVMMLADAVESASRTLSDPTAKRIEGLVKAISMKKLLDDQFDESSLTLSEIRAIEESLIKSLIAIYHGRIKYPEQRTA